MHLCFRSSTWCGMTCWEKVVVVDLHPVPEERAVAVLGVARSGGVDVLDLHPQALLEASRSASRGSLEELVRQESADFVGFLQEGV